MKMKMRTCPQSPAVDMKNRSASGVIIPSLFFKGVLVFILTFYFPIQTLFAENSLPAKNSFKKDSPVKITSESMKSFKNKNMVTFFTNVVVRKDNMTIFSDRLDLFTDKESKQLVRVVATGNVRIEQGDMSGTSEKAIYEEAEKKLTMLGNPIIIKRDNTIKGSKIVYFQEDESIVAEGDSTRKVEVTLFPEQLKEIENDGKR